jgi:hypothetical protein
MILRNTTFRSLTVLAMLFLSKTGQAQTEPPAPEKKEEGARVRIVCVKNLNEKDEKITIAKKTEDGKWIESGDLELHSSFVTDWVRVPVGLNHLASKNGAALTSLGSFTISPSIKRAILILLPDAGKKVYHVQLIDPAKLEFMKGKALVVNYSSIPALINMGKQSKTVNPGQQFVETITSDKDGMSPMRIGYQDKDQKVVLCYDRRVTFNPNTRSFILLFPDADTGLRAMTLSEFGPFE